MLKNIEKYRGHGLQNATKTWQVLQKGWNCSCWMSNERIEPNAIKFRPCCFQRAIFPVYLDRTKTPSGLATWRSRMKIVWILQPQLPTNIKHFNQPHQVEFKNTLTWTTRALNRGSSVERKIIACNYRGGFLPSGDYRNRISINNSCDLLLDG